MSLDERPEAAALESLLEALEGNGAVDRDTVRAGLADLVDRVGEATVHLLEMVDRGAPLTVALSHPALTDVLELCGIDASPSSPRPPAVDVPVQITPSTAPRCEVCGAARAVDGHAHVADIEARRLCCVCDACRVLFDAQGQGRFRAIPEGGPRHVVSGREPRWWTELDLPVGLLFLLRPASADRLVAAYPGPAGVVESDREVTGVPSDLWPRVDVEALIAVASAGELDAWIVPVTTAYALAGRLRAEAVMGDPLSVVRALVDELLA